MFCVYFKKISYEHSKPDSHRFSFSIIDSIYVVVQFYLKAEIRIGSTLQRRDLSISSNIFEIF